VPSGAPAWTTCVTGLDGWVNYMADPHFAANDSMSGYPLPYTVFADAEEPPNQCGDLDFNDRTRSFRSWYATAMAGESPWKYWWRRSRRADNGNGVLYEAVKVNRPAYVFGWDTVHVPLGNQYDAIGVILVLSPDSTLQINDTMFVDPSLDANVAVQHWAHREPPTFVSATRSGFNAVLTWSNQHAERALDSTNIYRDGTYLRTVGPSVESYVDSNLASGTYAYSLKHLSVSAVTTLPMGPAPYPNSPASDTLSVTIPAPPAVTISGEGYLWTPGSYTWTTSVTGGTSPYTYVWWFDPFGAGGPTQVSTKSYYRRTVTYQDMGFTLTVEVTDANQQVGTAFLTVFTDWGYGPMTGGQR
jgi:hypothetical protein